MLKVWHISPHQTFAAKPAPRVELEDQIICKEPRLDVKVCPLSEVPDAFETNICCDIPSLMVIVVPDAKLNCVNFNEIAPELVDAISLM